MIKTENLLGRKFTRLTVIAREADTIRPCGSKVPHWLCRCDCGKEVIVEAAQLKRGHTRSCGCYGSDIARARETKHGGGGTKLYRTWKNMRRRCFGKGSSFYDSYGGRGITICREWDDFSVFREWALANGYKENLTIDRIDVNGNYCPENCRWATEKDQANNKRNNRLITYLGRTQTLAQWCEEFGTPYGRAHIRIGKLKWDPVKAVITPGHPKRPPLKASRS